jgi:hypothetical protein
MTSADLAPAPKRPSDEKGRDCTHADQAEMGSVESPKLQQHEPPESSEVDEKKVIRKIDWRLIPLLTLLYTLTFLDRVNIGNARLWHLERDLHMTGYDYNIAILGESQTCMVMSAQANSVQSFISRISSLRSPPT